ncbi:hypothetical protein LWI29_027614 [Acer saccharum]|uniref:Uncharacterized protein n=1 Tax=Acer saccharum TaxID=4024 RepID=A0AA39W7R1_ACESA|nr:hypothetical protein LWI29_027614 [Acer saccharum]
MDQAQEGRSVWPAKELGPDQIDALAKSRDGRYRIVSNDERVQTLNQLLTERQERHRSCLLGDGTDDLDAVKWELYWTTLRR